MGVGHGSVQKGLAEERERLLRRASFSGSWRKVNMLKKIIKKTAGVSAKETLGGCRAIRTGDEKIVNNGQGRKFALTETVKRVMA